MSDIRVRFAPSPTGPLHIGGLRTALFNYLFARKHQGTFVLRIEDTDRTRFVDGAEEYILKSLVWCGIEPDEGVGKNGAYGPYRQSERKGMYRQFADQLVKSGDAYYAFDTPDELDARRKSLEQDKKTFTYDARERMQMKNSLTMGEEETRRRIDAGDPYVIRFRFNPGESIQMKDIVRGDVEVNSTTLDDKILFKSDGMPTYHLANVVDDHEMKISHVIRGEEWLPSLPLHVSLYKALGWENEMPQFAHLPLILKPSGKGKLSKRDGEQGGFPVFPLEWKDSVSGEVLSGYREEGYFPEACINILAFLGWNPGTEKELYTLDELVNDFDLEKVGRAGAKFDPDKARWYNHHYLQKHSDKELAGLFTEDTRTRGVVNDIDKAERIVSLVKERVTFVSELWDQASFFYEAPATYDEKVVKKRWKEQTPAMMSELTNHLESADDFSASALETSVKSLINERDWGMGAVMNAWRLLLVGTSKGPGLFDIAEILGKEEVVRRMKTGIDELS